MKILYVSSEVAPFSASGGLGDVIGALPSAVKRLGNECTVISPLYKSICEKHRRGFEHIGDITFSLGWRKTGASVYGVVENGVRYIFLENHYYFDRQQLYGEFDDIERFAFFSRAVVEYILQSGDVPDVLHANDWQTAAVVVYLKTEYSSVRALKKIKTLYTIHNIEYQGKCDPYILGDVFGLDVKYLGTLEYNGAINLMKGAIVTADFVTTVSPNYANELEYDFFAFGLSNVIKANKNKIKGVINGIDYSYFSPEYGGDIYQSYDIETVFSGKAENKKMLREELGLSEMDRPMLVMITRLAEGKGIELVFHVLEELLALNLEIVVLGSGEKEYERRFALLSETHENLVAIMRFDRVFSKKLYAAADMFLMPSKSEPCGLAQMIACSYGAVPIVRRVGGLFDSIKPYGGEAGNGFCFDNYNAHELLYTVKEALKVYENRKEWEKLVLAAKASNFSWESSAQKYIAIYHNLISR